MIFTKNNPKKLYLPPSSEDSFRFLTQDRLNEFPFEIRYFLTAYPYVLNFTKPDNIALGLVAVMKNLLLEHPFYNSEAFEDVILYLKLTYPNGDKDRHSVFYRYLVQYWNVDPYPCARLGLLLILNIMVIDPFYEYFMSDLVTERKNYVYTFIHNHTGEIFKLEVDKSMSDYEALTLLIANLPMNLG